MKIACVGTDPAALYLGILLKRRDRSDSVRFIETGGTDRYVPVSIVCNSLRPRFELEDAETREAIAQALAKFDKVIVTIADKEITIGGMRYAAADPAAVADVLKQRALALGCEFARRSVNDEDRKADVLIAADGANSPVRNVTAGFKTALSRSTN
jgi:anthraniloyl-CoA monooxygenase